MREKGLRLRRILGELRRRKVFRVAVAYGAGAFALVQVAAAAFPALHLPPAAITLVVVLAILGFPLALLLSWAYDVTPDRAGWSIPAAEDDLVPPEDESGAQSDTAGAAGSRAMAPAGEQSSRETATARRRDSSIDNLPAQLTPFIGRRDELNKISALVRLSDCRLLTICGTGGVGKTRLALEAAAANRHLFTHGVCFVPLSSLSSAGPLIATIAEHLGLTLSSREEAKRQLLDYLRAKSLLLVLDNFEHLAEAGGVLSEILEHASTTHIVVTSRERLNLHGETLFQLEGLHFPPAERLADAAQYEAVQLFLQSARRVQPDFRAQGAEAEAVARICSLVEGIPLAMELASAWVRVLSCAEIAYAIQRDRDFLRSSFRDVPERHRSLRAVFESAWRLLPEAEKTAYRRLALFRAGFTREAAERVARTSFPLLLALLDKSLLHRADSGRFEILEVLRQFAEERLQADPLEYSQVQQLHADYYLDLLNRLDEQVDASEAAELIGMEIENCRAAWRYATRTRQLKPIARSMDALFAFYDAHGWAREGEEMFAAAAAALSSHKGKAEVVDPARELVLAGLRVRQGAFCSDLGLNLKARELLERGLAQFRARSDRRQTAFALDQLGNILTKEGRYLEAQRIYSESIGIYRELGDSRSIGRLATHLGIVAFALGNYEEAKRLYRESASILKQIGDRSGLAAPLRNHGIIAAVQESHSEANALFLESLAIDRQLDNRRGIVHSLQNLGFAAYSTGAYAQAEVYLYEGITICREMGFRRLLAFCLNALANVAAAQDRAERARELYHQALRIAIDIGETPLILEILIGTARLRKETADYEGAVELLALIHQHPASDQDTRDTADHVLGELAETMPGAAFRAASERGKATELASAAQRVLDDPIFLGAPAKK